MKSLAFALVLLVGCQKEAPKPAEPSPELVQAMLEYCKVGELPRDKWREAQRAWGFTNGGNEKVMPIWNRAARDKHPEAIKLVRAAATKAMGGELNCPILDVLDHPERIPPKAEPTP